MGGCVEPRAVALARGAARPAGETARGDHGVRRQRPRPALAAPAQPALAAGGRRDGRVDRRAAARPARGGRASADGAVEVLFRGLDRGVEGEEEQQYERSLPLEDALREEVLLAYAMNGEPLPPQHGFPLRLIVPGLVRDDERQVARADHRARPSPSRATSRRAATASARRPTRQGEPVDAHGAALADGPAGHPRLRHPRAHAEPGPCTRARPRLVGLRPDRARRGQRRRRGHLERRARSAPQPSRGLGAAGSGTGTRRAGRRTSSAAGPPTAPATCSRSRRRGTSAATPTTRCSGCRSPSPSRPSSAQQRGRGFSLPSGTQRVTASGLTPWRSR